MSGGLSRFNILLQAAHNSDNSEEQLECISRILNLNSSEMEASELYVSFCKKMLRSSTPRIRKDTLYLISKLWPSISPSPVEIFTHYTKDDDSSVRATAIQALSNKVSADYFKLFFQDDSDTVQICAMTSFFQSSRQMGNDDGIFTSLSNQAFSSFHSVTLHSIKLIGQLSPSMRHILESIVHDPKVPRSAFLLWLLESEHCEIRMAVLDTLESLTLRLLSQNSFENIGSLIWRTVKLMLDAINDEFEEVRLKVFTFLEKLTPYFTLKRVEII